MPILSPHILLLLFAETPLSRQTRTVGHTVCVRVLQPAIPHQKLTHHTQELATSWIEWDAEASTQNVGHQKRTRTTSRSIASTASVRFRRRARPAATRHQFQGEALGLNERASNVNRTKPKKQQNYNKKRRESNRMPFKWTKCVR